MTCRTDIRLRKGPSRIRMTFSDVLITEMYGIVVSFTFLFFDAANFFPRIPLMYLAGMLYAFTKGQSEL